MAMASQSTSVKQAVVEATAELPASILAEYPALATFTGRDGECINRSSHDHTVQQGTPSSCPGSVPMCSICIGEIECDDPITTLPCGHCYHSTCVHNWLRHS